MTVDMNLMLLMRDFDTDAECRSILAELRWPKGVTCLKCGSQRVSRVPSRSLFQCNACDHQFSVTAGTIFHDSRLPLPKWFLAVYLMVEAKKSISAAQIQRTLDIKTYKTAWYLCHRIRAAMREANPTPLTGTLEADETYVGGRVRGKGKGYVGNKAIVAGVIQRGGSVRLQKVPNNGKAVLQGFVRAHIAPETEAIHTDEHAGYIGIQGENRRHETVNHKAEEYVRAGVNGPVHTNSVENVWSLLDRSIMGAFHHVSIKHLDAYLDEQEWRFNNRKSDWLFRNTLVKLLTAQNLEYKQLTGSVQISTVRPPSPNRLASLRLLRSEH